MKSLVKELMKSFKNENRYGIEPNTPWFKVTSKGQTMLHKLFEIAPDMDDINLDIFTLRFEWLNHDQFWIVK